MTIVYIVVVKEKKKIAVENVYSRNYPFIIFTGSIKSANHSQDRIQSEFLNRRH